MKTKADLFIVSFHVITSLLPKLHKKLALSVNNHPIPLSTFRHPEEKGLIFEGIISKKMLPSESNIIELVFSVPQLLRPCDVTLNNEDTRELGFACKSVVIKPSGNPKLPS